MLRSCYVILFFFSFLWPNDVVRMSIVSSFFLPIYVLPFATNVNFLAVPEENLLAFEQPDLVSIKALRNMNNML